MSTRDQNKYEMPWRPTYEVYAALGWGASLAGILATGASTHTPLAYSASMGCIAATGMAYRSWQTKKHFDFRLALAGTEFFLLPMDEVTKRTEPDHMWMGLGWDWDPIHTQRYDETQKRNIQFMLPPRWYRKLKKIPDYEDVVGAPWIHGLNPDEDDIQLPLNALEGHVGVYGTTGSGKTRFLETVCSQIIANPNNVLIILDPKGDKELRDIARHACIRSGRPDKFIMFHPGFASESIRFDPLKNWTRKTQLASRIAMLMQGDEGFKNFAWLSINTVTDGLLYIGVRPNLKLIKKYVAGGPDELMVEVLEQFFKENIPAWESQCTAFVTKATKDAGKGEVAATLNKGASATLVGYVDFYTNHVPKEIRANAANVSAVDGLLNLTRHNREHYGKVIMNLLPLLDMLTAGELGDMLSPDAQDMNDRRPIFDTDKIIEGGYVLYMGLDSLSDATTGSALAGIVLADLAAKMGEIYNYTEVKGQGRIHLIVDEAAEAVNDPMIQLLNKGRGAGLVCWLLTQTFPDFIAKMDSEPKARQILGNLNNIISFRLQDQVTQQFVSDQFGETYITKMSKGYSTGSRSEDSGMAHQGAISQTTSEEKVPKIPIDLLSKLPNLHFVAKVGGKIKKGRLPKLI